MQKSKIQNIKINQSKKRAFFDDKLSEYIGKPKELWETLKSLGTVKKPLISNFNAIESNNTLTFDKKAVAKTFEDFFSNLAGSLAVKVPNAPNKYNLESVFQYYSTSIIEKPLHLRRTFLK